MGVTYTLLIQACDPFWQTTFSPTQKTDIYSNIVFKIASSIYLFNYLWTCYSCQSLNSHVILQSSETEFGFELDEVVFVSPIRHFW